MKWNAHCIQTVLHTRNAIYANQCLGRADEWNFPFFRRILFQSKIDVNDYCCVIEIRAIRFVFDWFFRYCEWKFQSNFMYFYWSIASHCFPHWTHSFWSKTYSVDSQIFEVNAQCDAKRKVNYKKEHIRNVYFAHSFSISINENWIELIFVKSILWGVFTTSKAKAFNLSVSSNGFFYFKFVESRLAKTCH